MYRGAVVGLVYLRSWWSRSGFSRTPNIKCSYQTIFLKTSLNFFDQTTLLYSNIGRTYTTKALYK